MPQKTPSTLRPKQLLLELSRNIPTVWEDVKSFRKAKGKDLPDWPDWCYMPIAGGYAISMAKDPSGANLFDPLFNPASITALATWRVSQGVYRFDIDLFNSLVNQPLDGNLPCDAFKHLPEWCVYIETHGTEIWGVKTEGFFAHLESDANDSRVELRLLIVPIRGDNIPIPLHLGDWTLHESLQRMRKEAEKHVNAIAKLPQVEKSDTNEIVPFLQLLLYLCAENADMPIRPKHPLTRVRMSGQVDVPKEARFWKVGERIGAGIRKYHNEMAKQQESNLFPEKSDNARLSPRPHIRRAHWHHFWTGPKTGDRKLVLRWLPPVPVKYDEQDGPVVIHRVK